MLDKDIDVNIKKMFSLAVAALAISAVSFHAEARGHSSHSRSYGTGSSHSYTHVSGYHRSNGRYVSPHMRTSKNSTRSDNFSTRGNYNPFTHRKGTK